MHDDARTIVDKKGHTMPSNDEDADLQDALLRGGETGRREVEREKKKSTQRERERRNGHS
jgi:hypothetical protein